MTRTEHARSKRNSHTVNAIVPRRLSLTVLAGLCIGAAGCGDDGVRPVASSPKDDAKSTATPAKSSTPRAEWVLATCRGLGQINASVQPPSVQPSSPSDTKASLERFYNDLSKVLSEQEKALAAVGTPPGANARRDYRETLGRIRDVQAQLAELKGRVQASDLKTADDLNELLEALGRRMQKMASYQGPMADLIRSRALGKAIDREPACSKLSSGLVTKG